MRIFSSLEVRDFRFYWFGSLISLVGSWIQMIAQGWLIFQLTKSEFLLGFIGFLSSIPIIIFSLPSGVISDRKDKRNILILTQTILMLLAFVLGFLTSSGLIKVWHIIVIVLFTGTAMALDGPTRQSFVLELVGTENLSNAIGLNSAAFNVARIIGPAIAGVIIGVRGPAVCFYINGISFIAAIGALFLIKRQNNFQNNKPNGKSMLDDLKQGLDYLFSNRKLLILIILVAIQSLIVMPYVTLMPVFAEKVLNKGAQGLGVLMSSAGIGALLGALSVAAAPKTIKKEKMIFYGCVVFSLFLVLFALSKIYWLSIISLVFVGWGTITSMANINTLIQINVPNELRGRIMSIFMLAFGGSMPFGNLLAGVMSSLVNVQFTFACFGIISFIVSLFFWKKKYLG